MRRDGEPVPLTPKAFDVLAALVAQPGRLVSKQELLDKVWPNTFVEESNLTYNVFALRRALGDAADNGQYIETVPKRGYRFAAALTPINARAGGQPLAREVPDGTPPQVAPARPRYQTMADLPSSRVPRRLFDLSRRWTIAAAALLVAVAYFVAQSWRASSNEPMRALPLTSMTGVVRSPSLSPDGTHVVFTWTGEKQDNPDLYVQQVGADGYVRLTTDPGNDYSPSWSPDGRKIAFLRRGPDGGRSEVRTIGPLGGPERKVADIQPRLAFFRPTSLAWCPDSTCVVATDTSGDDKPDGLFVISLDTGEKRPLTSPPVTNPPRRALDADPAISPDGRSLIFRRDATPFSGSSIDWD